MAESFTAYRNNSRNNSFLSYQSVLQNSNWDFLYDKYPVSKCHISQQKNKIIALIKDIVNNYKQDRASLYTYKLIGSCDIEITDMDIGVGDFHNGKSTAILQLKEKQKLVYKPTDANISFAYYRFLDWVNDYSSLGDYKYNILNGEGYHWLEFVNHTACKTEDELAEYYMRAGFVLCVVYLLSGRDFHYENIIANGSSPVLIDHETIIQPKIPENLKLFFKSFGKGEQDSVFDSLLLPNKEAAGLLPMGMCGFGWHKQTHFQGIEKIGVNRFTDNWKMVTRFVTQDLFKNNIPICN